jgi:hypothetical protein
MTARTLSNGLLRRLAPTLGLGVLLAAFAGVGTAGATEAIESFETTTSTTQAGAHPDLHTTFSLNSPGVPEAAENVSVETPPGIFGNPNAVEQCTQVVFAQQECPPTSQVGLITVYANYEGKSNDLLGTVPIYNIEPTEAETALFGFITPTLNIPIQIPVLVRTGSDYGLTFKVSEITQVTPLAGADLTFWGFPGSNIHESQRFPKGTTGRPSGCVGLANTSCLSKPTAIGIPIRPLTVNPNDCDGKVQPTHLRVQTYQDPNNESEEESSYPPVTECEKQLFKPLLFARPTSNATDSASGLDIILRDTQFLGFAVSPAEIRESTVVLPPGLTINPDAADGQTSCSDAQANFGSEGPAECPDSAKIGTAALHSPALSGPLPGSLYIGEPQPGNQYRLFLIVSGFGIHAKLVGTAKPDPQTGQISIHFENLPQVPFDSFEFHLFSSDRGLMATPTACTIYTTEAKFVPWNHFLPEATSSQVFGLTSGPNGAPCPGQKRPFNPTLAAGTSNSQAGAFSAFSLQLNREDGDQFLGDLTFRMPPGFTGDLRGISYCSDAAIASAAQRSGRSEQAAPSCPASSLVGSTNVAAGPGNHPFHAVGKMYLSGPFKGAPLSVAAVTPALAGPYDYGVVVVRVALHVDPQTAQVFAASDTVPSIIGGIPLRMRSIRVSIDRPDFTINPTNCSPLSVDSQGIGDQGTIANFSSYFHADNCATMPFKPRMTIRQLGGRKVTKRSSNAGLKLDLRTRPGDANIKSLSVTLPTAFEIDQRHLGNICSERELAETQCAGRAPIGKASTTTPLLDQPLAGPVYAVSGSGGLPRLAFILNGQVNLVPRADTKTDKSRLKTTAPVVPDAAIGHFELTVFGGKTGYLVNTRDICQKTPVVQVDYTGQNGKTLGQKVKMKTSCGGKSSRHREIGVR